MALNFNKPKMKAIPGVKSVELHHGDGTVTHYPHVQTEVQTEATPALHIPKVEMEQLAVTLQDATVKTAVDTYLKLFQWCEANGVKDVLKKMEAIRQSLQSIANEQGKDAEPFTFQTPKGAIEFSPRGTKTVVSDPKLLILDLEKKFNTGVAYGVVDIRLGELRKVLNELEVKQYAEEMPGSRSIKSVRPAK